MSVESLLVCPKLAYSSGVISYLQSSFVACVGTAATASAVLLQKLE
ncbi:hypothetical protein AVDCRST_MAG92-5606 [uncultured Coleofasciculus sp.]|uniref:Uncharacterized protein n=1 Tax=uncultured Coleofasciculus sp. TaxID=1267456 RepID=A0A6J4KJG8_9CYAN|nr:hypothetical protein AVDCRST_MAG92-5606 [uncultured Coleofasciculus sp.]